MTRINPCLLEPTVEIEELSHWYGLGAMRKKVIQSISMKISPGQVVLLTGPSGCGKTTLLTLIGALRKIEEGNVKVFGKQSGCGLQEFVVGNL